MKVSWLSFLYLVPVDCCMTLFCNETGGDHHLFRKKMRKRKLDENAVGSSEKKGTKSEILTQQFKQGDLTWVEIHKSSWWPAQVKE